MDQDARFGGLEFKAFQIVLTLAITSKALCDEIRFNKNWMEWLGRMDLASQKFYSTIYHGNFYQQAFIAAGKDSAFHRMCLTPAGPNGIEFHIAPKNLRLQRIEAFITQKDFVQLSFFLHSTSGDSLDDVIDILHVLKNPESRVGKKGAVLSLAESLGISAGVSIDGASIRNIYLFLNAETASVISKKAMIDGCHQAGNLISRENYYQNKSSEVYFQKQIEDHGLDLFESWFALILNDTFVRISNGQVDPFRRWEKDYVSVYLYQLALKNYLSRVNSKLASVTGLKRSIRKTKDEFIEFLNDTQFNRISTKFLPNILYEKLNNSLGVKEEMVILEKKLDRINDHLKEKREEAFNTALIIITMLSVFTVVLDVSLWFEKIGFLGDRLWPMGSLVTAGVIVLLILVFFLFRTKR